MRVFARAHSTPRLNWRRASADDALVAKTKEGQNRATAASPLAIIGDTGQSDRVAEKEVFEPVEIVGKLFHLN